MNHDRLRKQLDFIFEVDKIKSIIRKTKLFDKSRFENDAEHSWTVCLMALAMKEYANFTVDIEKVIQMLLIHDVIEVYCGDTFLYAKERESIHVKEDEAAKKIFGMLEADQRDFYYKLWCEFEARETNEAKFAAVFDRLEPLLQNFKNEGYTWKANGITKEMVIAKNSYIADGSEELWAFARSLIDESVELGYLAEKE